MLLCGCGGQSQSGDALDTTKMEKPDSESIVSLAQVMGEDLTRFLHEDDIQSAAALCQEGLDNIMYFRDTGDMVSAEIYTTYLHEFVKKHYDDMEDMATQNYVVKQFMAAVGDSAILHAQRRRWPQEEDTHNEPTVEADGPAPTRPAVKHWKKQNIENDEASTSEETATKSSSVSNKTKSAAKAGASSAMNKAKTATKAGASGANKAKTAAKAGASVATNKAKTATKAGASVAMNKAQTAAKAGASAGVRKSSSNVKGPKTVANNTSSKQQKSSLKQQESNAGTGNSTQVKQKKEPIVVKCKKTNSGITQKSSGEATSSQWYLVLPLD